jgi:hypothetical protein
MLAKEILLYAQSIDGSTVLRSASEYYQRASDATEREGW